MKDSASVQPATEEKPTIGFIGQGWIGKHYADDFAARGYRTVRYGLEPEYQENKAAIATCPITFIAVPTPTTPDGFDDSVLRSVLTLVGNAHIAVIKSTTIPGLVEALQRDFPHLVLLHSPEFLVEKTAAYDAANPNRNIIGLADDTPKHKGAAEAVLAVLPPAPYQAVMSARESELVKYAGNGFLYAKVLFMNVLHDVVEKSGGDYAVVREALINDPRIGETHTEPVHDSGRGAGGHCFIKDFEAFRQYYKQLLDSDEGHAMLTAMATYNNKLLRSTKKDLDLLTGVYGKSVCKGTKSLE